MSSSYSCKYAKDIGKKEELIYCSKNECICSFDIPDYNSCCSKYNGDSFDIYCDNNLTDYDFTIYDEIGVDDIGEE